MLAVPPYQEYNWGIGGIEVEIPINAPQTKTLYHPPDEPPAALQLSRCNWPEIEPDLNKQFLYAHRSSKFSGNYNLAFDFKAPARYAFDPFYGLIRQHALQVVSPGLFSLAENLILDSRSMITYQWNLNTRALSSTYAQEVPPPVSVKGYGGLPAGDSMVLMINRPEGQLYSEEDIRIEWKYQGQGTAGTGSFGNIELEASYEVFNACRGPAVMQGDLFSLSTRDQIRDTDAVYVRLPEDAIYIQIVTYVAAESYAQPDDQAEASIELEISVDIETDPSRFWN